MYKLLNKIFGWDYISWQNTCDDGIARVFKTKCGKVVYLRYKHTKVLDIIKNKDQVLWLKCEPEKYLKESK